MPKVDAGQHDVWRVVLQDVPDPQANGVRGPASDAPNLITVAGVSNALAGDTGAAATLIGCGRDEENVVTRLEEAGAERLNARRKIAIVIG